MYKQSALTSIIDIYQQLQNTELTKISPRCFGPNFTSVTEVRLSTRFPRLTHRCSWFSATSNIGKHVQRSANVSQRTSTAAKPLQSHYHYNYANIQLDVQWYHQLFLC